MAILLETDVIGAGKADGAADTVLDVLQPDFAVHPLFDDDFRNIKTDAGAPPLFFGGKVGIEGQGQGILGNFAAPVHHLDEEAPAFIPDVAI